MSKSKHMNSIIVEHVNINRIKRLINLQKPVLDISCSITNKARDQLTERQIEISEFNGVPKVLIQLDREQLNVPDHIETNEDMEEFVQGLLKNQDLTIKLETSSYGGIFKWFPDKENLLLVFVYGVNPVRNKHSALPSTDYPIKLKITATKSDEGVKLNIGRILFSAVRWLKDNEREKLDIDYKRFLDKSFKPYVEFLYYERVSIKDPKFRPSCRYTKLPQEDGRVYLEVSDPPRQLTEGGNSITAKDDSGNSYLSSRVSDFDESEQLIIIEETERVKLWPEKGIIFLEGDMASNRRKTQAVNLLRTRTNLVYAKLADLLIRPWGLAKVDALPRSYFHPNISHTSPISNGQAKAVDLALSSDDISLIHGPPGTGKTTVIVEIIRHMVANGKRVVMVAPTHVAVDNVLERIADERGIYAVRVGGRKYMSDELKKYRLNDRVEELYNTYFSNLGSKDSKAQKLRKEFLNQMQKKDRKYFENLVLGKSNLVCGTTIGIARYYEKSTKDPINFDMLIIDEASKATVMEFLVPAVRARKWVLVGDHRQLPPYVNDQELRIYVQRYFEGVNNEDSEAKSSDKLSNRSEFHENTDLLIGYLRRFHEELHALGEGETQFYWKKIIELLDYNKPTITSIEEMVNLALGSCFHYFLKNIDESRNAKLDVQHRMPEILANFLDQSIYLGDLKTSDTAARHGYELPSIRSLGLPKLKSPITFVSTENYPNPNDSSGKWKGYRNQAEADAIAEIIVSLVTKLDVEKLGYTKENPMTIGVITYYADQSRAINQQLRLLDELIPERGWRYSVPKKPIKVRVSIVDRFQGQEQDIVLLSLTRSNPQGNIGFLTNLQRVNVSLSRAKHNLLVIGNHQFYKSLKKKKSTVILHELAKYTAKHKLVKKIQFR